MRDRYTIELPHIPESLPPRDEIDNAMRAHAALGINPHQPIYSKFPLQAVTARSPITHRRALHRMATYFRREFRYDFIQYDPSERESDHVGYLFLERNWDDTIVVGGTIFRWREYTQEKPGWAMAWIWLHPYERHRGRLTAVWPYFRERFGVFDVEGPISPAMQAFLAKQAIHGESTGGQSAQ